MNEIPVIGSSNTDMVIKTEKLPCPGETIMGGTFMVNSGGKGANQAVLATRIGAQASAPYRKDISNLHSYAKNKSYAHFSFIT